VKSKNLIFNTFFWLVYFTYEWLGNATIDNQYERYLINAAVIVPITCLASIFTVHVLIEKYYLKNKKQLFWTGLAVSMFVFVMARRCFNFYYNYPIYWPEGYKTMSLFFLPKVIIEAVSTYLIVAVYTMFYFIRAWYDQQRISAALKEDKISSELELLKSQVHPHFIFNTLNNIYSLSLQKSEKAPDLIYRLSSFLSYNLYDSKQHTIPVSKELEYINNYIELEKIRYGAGLDVSVNVYDSLDGFEVSPLLFLPLVENCFKHGINGDTEGCWIRIDLTVQKDWLTLKIENSHTRDKHVIDENKNGNSNGIGLENVKRRLEILYPGRHEFRCIHENQSYLTIVKIKKTVNEPVKVR
jgi:hypothetical protein